MRALPSLALIVASLLFTRDAWADRIKVAVGDVRGPEAKQVTDALERTLGTDADVQLVVASVFKASGGKMDGVAAVVGATIKKAGGKFDVQVTVVGPGGETLKTWRIKTKKANRLGPLIEQDLWNKIGPTLKSLSGSSGGSDASAPPPPPTPGIDPNVKRLGVLKVEGSAKTKAELLVLGAFKTHPGFFVVPGDELRGAALKLSAQLDDPNGRVAIAKQLKISAWLTFKLEEKSGGIDATGGVIDAVDGRSLSQAQASGKNVTNLSRDLKLAMIPLIERTRVPSGEASALAPPPPAAPPPPKASSSGIASAPPPPPPPSSSSPPPPASTSAAGKVETPAPGASKEKIRSNTPLDLSAGLRLFTRSLSYKDDLFGQLRPYDLPGAPAIDVRALWYPAAHFSSGFATHIGVELGGAYALGLKTLDNMDREFSTSSLSFLGGLHGRVPFGRNEVGLGLGFGLHSFTLSGTDGPEGIDFPSVSYSFVRAGLDARFEPVGGLHLRARGAYRVVLSIGEMGEDDWFPRASTGGIDAGLGVGYEVVTGFEVRLDAGLERYFYSMKPEPGDPKIAGGAVDQYLSATLGISFYL